MTIAATRSWYPAMARIVFGIVLAAALFSPLTSWAAEKADANKPTTGTPPTFSTILSQGLLRANISDSCQKLGKCEITDMIQIALNVMVFILGISGSVFLLMFVWGGFTWLTSGGAPGKIDAGLNTLRDAVIGLIVVFGAYTLVNSALSLISTGTLPTGDIDQTLKKMTPVETIQIKSK